VLSGEATNAIFFSLWFDLIGARAHDPLYNGKVFDIVYSDLLVFNGVNKGYYKSNTK
jgi:hypothetical protein